jgi:hypothetical protein
LDTDLDPDIAQRLNIMGLPTLLFLDKFEPKEGDEDMGARAVLKGRVEGTMVDLNFANAGVVGRLLVDAYTRAARSLMNRIL